MCRPPGAHRHRCLPHVSVVLLKDPDVTSIDTDAFVLGDDRDATGLVQEIAGAIPGARGSSGGRLRNAH